VDRQSIRVGAAVAATRPTQASATRTPATCARSARTRATSRRAAATCAVRLTKCTSTFDYRTGGDLAKSFYELEAATADGGVLKFDELKGKVVLITNVASE